ncbi:uncharacterized protein [Narcine bancroftii]|uniref:uncharacterized protein n=1 Tax=Narcine bancroftii TaxID=1343680 RepID=UPI003831D5D8
MRSQPLDENESIVNVQWRNNDDLTKTFGHHCEEAPKYHNFTTGNTKSCNKSDKGIHTHCQNRAEKRREGFNYKRDGRYRKRNITGRGKEERDKASGQAIEDEELCSLHIGKMAPTEEERKCVVSSLQHEGEDFAFEPILNEKPDGSKGNQGPGLGAETKYLSNEERAGNDGSKLECAGGLLEDAMSMEKDHCKLDASMHAEAKGSSLRAEIDPPCEDNAALNCDQSLRSSTGYQQCSVDSKDNPRMLENWEKKNNSDNVMELLKSGDFKEEGAFKIKTEHDVGHPQNLNVLLKELSSCLGENNISIEQPKSDYSTYLSGELQAFDVDFGHIIEIYDFPPHVKTEDIQDAFGSFRHKGFRIKWVDSSHALGIFSSPDSAAEALVISHEQFKTQPLSQATKQSKLKVSRCSEFLQPVKERAQVNTAIAKRLVSRALGFQTTERRGRPDPKPKKLNEDKVQLHKTEDESENTLKSGSEQN